ncbi:MAG: OB-fold nucleic acid binding domain-containing protein [Candidatus Woesearchaeota archaeon]
MEEKKKISDIRMGDRNVDFEAEVAELGEVRTFNKFGKDGKVQEAKIKDDSGQTTLVLWNEQAESLSVGDKITVKGAYTKEFRGELQVHIARQGSLEKQ